jgi:two-component system cell cycle sensor histidine kinase/response regulator CckA
MPHSRPPSETAVGTTPPPPRPAPPPGEAAALYLVRTLVVDRDAATRDLLAAAAGQRGHHVTVAGSPEEAAAALAAQPPDCLILKLRASWAASLTGFLDTLATRPARPSPHVIAVVLDDPPPRPADWLDRGVDDIVIGLTRGQELELRLAVAEQRIARRRREEAERHQALAETRHFETLFRSQAQALLVVTAHDGLVLDANPAATRLLGLPLQDVRDRFVSLLLPDLVSRDPLVQEWEESGGPLQLTDLNHHRPDGSRCELDIAVSRCFWSNQPALCLLLHEVGPARRAETDRLRQARLEATRAVAAGAAASLNDALTAVRGNLDLLTRQNTPRAEAESLLKNAHTACQHAEETVRTLASLARASHATTRRRRTDLPPLLNRWISTALLNGRARIEVEQPTALPAVEIDETSLREALLALLLNAEESMPHGGRLHITTTTRPGPDPAHPWIAIEVTDSGHGIPREALARLCDPYFTSRPGHLGLGLTRAAAIIAAHHGHLEFDSDPGTGTTARILLPAAEPLGGPASDSPTPAPAPPHRRGRILVMDDDVGIRVVVEKMLSLQGFDVCTVRDGAETIAAYRRARDLGTGFDVVLLDLDVRAGMGGRECIARLRGEFPEVKALLTTGFSDDLILDNHREHGFSGVVTKPFNMERLVATVSRLAQA